MGIFSFTAHGPGKGVRKDERKLKRPLLLFYYLFYYFTSFIKASMLFTLFCIPVITIGPSICGLTFLMQSISEDKHIFLLSDFWEHFRKNFLKGMLSFIITLIPLFSLYTIFINMAKVPHFTNLIAPLIIVISIMFMMSFYIYPLMVFYDLPLWAIFKNAFIFTMIKLPFNLFITIILLCIIFAAFYFYPVIGYIITPLFLAAFINYFTVFSVWPTIKKHMEE